MALLDPSVWSGRTYVAGWRTTGSGSSPVREPATGATLGEIGTSSSDDVRHAVEVAAAAQRDWAASPPEQRAAVLHRAAQLWESHAAEVQSWLVREAGSIQAKAVLETHTADQECLEAAALPSHPLGSFLPSNEPRWSLTRRRPAGVVGVIAPFNFPLILSIRSVAPALALGNAVVLKPDPRTAVCGGVALVRVFEEAGLPPGVLSLVVGGADAGEALVTAPATRVVSFTGSSRAGRRVGALGAQHLTRVHLELGGNSAQVVLPGADVGRVASAGAFGSFMHQGQICMTTGRHLVHESLYEEYVSALAEKASRLPVGDPATEQVALGPVIDDAQVARIHDLVTASVAGGARLAAGGTHEGRFYRPTVLADVTAETPAYAEEVFGPVAPVRRFSTVEEAVAMARDSEYGLVLSVFGDLDRALAVADAVPSGIVHLNAATVSDEAHVPFGGVGDSGTGARFGGAEANLDAFTETQWVTLRPEPAPYPF
jgi:benzaldehyde dehydrogenase (NAD)